MYQDPSYLFVYIYICICVYVYVSFSIFRIKLQRSVYFFFFNFFFRDLLIEKPSANECSLYFYNGGVSYWEGAICKGELIGNGGRCKLDIVSDRSIRDGLRNGKRRGNRGDERNGRGRHLNRFDRNLLKKLAEISSVKIWNKINGKESGGGEEAFNKASRRNVERVKSWNKKKKERERKENEVKIQLWNDSRSFFLSFSTWFETIIG